MFTRHLAAAAALSALALAVSPAQALVVRAWVSGHGNDVAGCGAPTNPCRTLQYTHDSIVSAGGEIDILDPAGYGAITITKAISIVNDGVGTAGVQAATGSAITINASPGDNIYLRGLNVDGVHNAGANGIAFNTGSGLTVVNCVVRHFNTSGLSIAPTAGAASIAVYDSLFMENEIGIRYLPPSGDAVISVIMDHVRASKNANGGIELTATGSATGSASVTISNSDASDNGQFGVLSQSNATILSLRSALRRSSTTAFMAFGR
jgi:hypothetical protein